MRQDCIGELLRKVFAIFTDRQMAADKSVRPTRDGPNFTYPLDKRMTIEQISIRICRRQILRRKVRVETAIGVFASRAHAEDAVKHLWSQQVPEEAIVFLAPQDDSPPGSGSPQPSTKTGTNLLSVPGIGLVFALGLGAASLLGLGGGATSPNEKTPAAQPTPTDKCSDDIAFFHEVLKQGRSLVVVRSESLRDCENRQPHAGSPGTGTKAALSGENAGQHPAKSRASPSSIFAEESLTARTTSNCASWSITC